MDTNLKILIPIRKRARNTHFGGQSLNAAHVYPYTLNSQLKYTFLIGLRVHDDINHRPHDIYV